MSKQDELATFIHTCSADVIVGTETWLSPEIDSSEIEISKSFTVFRRDRDGRRGGDILIATKKHIPVRLVDVTSVLETLWTALNLPSITIVIGACYRPPDSSADFVDELHEVIVQIENRYSNSPIILTGDFNFPALNWSHSIQSTFESTPFLDFMSFFQLTQLVSTPTRADDILDLVLTTHPDSAHINVLECISDHRIVHCLFRFATKKEAFLKENGVRFG